MSIMTAIKKNNMMLNLCLSFFLSSQLIQTVQANAEAGTTYVQNNGSLDGYYEENSSLPITTTATSTASAEYESETEVSSSSSEDIHTTNQAITTATRAKVSSHESNQSEESSSTTVWWTQNSQNAEEASESGTDSTSTTVWWTAPSTAATTSDWNDNTSSLAAAYTTHSWWSEPSITAGSDTSSTGLENETTKTTSSFTTSEILSETPFEITSETSSSSTSTVTQHSNVVSTSVDSTCQTVWGQCGGLDYSGVTCCQNGYTCVLANSYWARCVAASTLETSATGTIAEANDTGISSSSTSSATTKKAGSAVIVSYTSASTVYDYSTALTSNTIISTNSRGSKITNVVASTSISKVAKGVSSVLEYSTSTNGASNKNNNGLITALFLGLCLVFGM